MRESERIPWRDLRASQCTPLPLHRRLAGRVDWEGLRILSTAIAVALAVLFMLMWLSHFTASDWPTDAHGGSCPFVWVEGPNGAVQAPDPDCR